MNRHSYLTLLGLAAMVMLAYLLGALAPPLVVGAAGANAPAAPAQTTAQKAVLQQALALLSDGEDNSFYLPVIRR
jgi:hypothetical protein